MDKEKLLYQFFHGFCVSLVSIVVVFIIELLISETLSFMPPIGIGIAIVVFFVVLPCVVGGINEYFSLKFYDNDEFKINGFWICGLFLLLINTIAYTTLAFFLDEIIATIATIVLLSLPSAKIGKFIRE